MARSGIPRRWVRKSACLAERLLDRLRSRLAPGGLLHYGQGKWYPGEPLPRWALACYWRADGIPLWHDRALLVREGGTYNFGPLDAQRFADALARRLGVDPDYVNQAFEDPLYYMQRERQLPVNVDPVDNHLEDRAGTGAHPAGIRARLEHTGGHGAADRAQPGLEAVRAGKPGCGCCAASGSC